VSLRGRLLLITVSLVGGGLLVAGILTYQALSTSLVDRVDDQLRAARGPAAVTLRVEAPFDPAPPPGTFELLPSGTYVELRDEDGQIVDSRVFGFGIDGPVDAAPQDLSATLPRVMRAPAGATRSSTVSTAAGPYRALATSLGPLHGTFTVATPLAEVQRTLNRLVVAEVVVGAAVLGLAAVLALWFVRVGLRPLEGIGETAGAIAAGDLSRRVEPADERTEVGRLGLSLNAMLAQIEAAFEERRASESRLRRFVADASHELRTPLTSIRGYAELFRRGADERPEDLEKSMARIEAEADRMGILVDDLLLLARLDQGRPLERDPVDLSVVVTDAVESARAVDPERPIDVESVGSAEVTGDAGRLRQVVDNLLDNARVHTPPGAPVHVRLHADDEVVLSVDDEGPGLGEEEVAKAFDRFYRGDPVRSRDTGGAGLGLSIVAAIVQAHGGSIEATSPEGSGARFEVRLPALDAAPAEPGTVDPPGDAT
jgi:two-component system OmpR family sensor kinase